MKSYGCESDVRHPEMIERARRMMPAEDTLIDASDLLKVLADSTRMRIAAALLEVELCVCDLSELLAMSQSAVSHQLRVLRQSRLVRSRRDGKNIFYCLTDRHVLDIIQTSLAHVREMYRSVGEEEEVHEHAR